MTSLGIIAVIYFVGGGFGCYLLFARPMTWWPFKEKIPQDTEEYPTGFYVGLYTSSPGKTGANEVTGDNYARQEWRGADLKWESVVISRDCDDREKEPTEETK